MLTFAQERQAWCLHDEYEDGLLSLSRKEPFPASGDLLWGGLAGIAGVVGLLSFYSALASGKMGIAAPVSAVLTAALPVLFSVFTAGLPTLPQLAGFVLALLAIGLISRRERATGQHQGIGLAVVTGCGFGCFFILISRVSTTATFWPLAVARFTSILVLLIMAQLRRKPLLPARNIASLMMLAGILDAIGNAFFLLAAHSGRLDVAAILSSLYPAATVGLAVLVLHERATCLQAIGILLVLVAFPMISV